MKFRNLFISVLVIIMMVAGTAGAQDIDPCFGLSADDCSYIDQASANGVGDATSFTVEWNLAVAGSGIPDPTMAEFSFGSVGSIDMVENMNPIIPIDMGSVQDITIAGGGMNETMTVEFRMVDGMFYMQDPTSGEWMSMDIVAIMSDPEIMDEMLGGMGLSMEDLMSGDMGAMGMEGMPDMEQIMPLLDLLNIEGFMTYTRSGDTFTFVVDLTALNALFAPENEATLNAIVDLATEVDPENGPMVGMMLPMVLQIVEEGTITITQVVDPELMIVDSIGFNTAMTINAGMLTGETDAAPIVVSIDFLANVVNLNSAPAPQAVEGATQIDPQTGQPVGQ